MSRLPSLQNIGRSVRRLVTRPPVELNPAEAYELWAATYDDTRDNGLLHVEAPIVQGVLAQTGLRNKSVLDAGCGTGRHLPAIQQFNPGLLTAIDLSPAMLQRARDKVSPNITASLQVASVEHLPFKDEIFDFVLSTLVLAHVQDLRLAISELSRVTRSGGTQLISCFHPFGKLLSWQRSFQTDGSSGKKNWFSAKYYFHLHADYYNALKTSGMDVLEIHEPVIDEEIRPFYERAGRLDIYQQFSGYPLLLVFLARKR